MNRNVSSKLCMLAFKVSMILSATLFAENTIFAKVATITLATANPVPLNRKLFGMNTAMEGRPYDFTHPEVTALSKAIAVPLVRYPGGTIANFLNWRTAGLMPEKVAHGSFTGSAYKKYVSNFANSDGRTTTIEEIVSFAHVVGDADIVWVANILTGDPASSAAWVKNNKEKGYSNTYWELGNEYYLKAYKQKYPDAETYIAEAKSHAKAMREIDPNIKTGIVTASYRHIAGAVKVEGDAAQWVAGGGNDELKWNDAIAKEIFYDGVISHDYFIPKKCWLESAETVHTYFMARCAVEYPKMVAYYRALCGNDVRIWLTEYNIHPIPYHDEIAKAGSNVNDYFVTKSLTHALYIADILLQMIKFSKNFEMAHMHVLAAPFFWGLFNAQYPEKDHVNDPFITNLTWYVFRTFAAATAGCDKMATIDINDSPKLTGTMEFSEYSFPALVAAAFYNKSTVRSIVILNKSLSSQTVAIDSSIVKATAFTADDPLESWGKKKDCTEMGWRASSRIESCVVSGNSVVLPRSSLSFIRMK